MSFNEVQFRLDRHHGAYVTVHVSRRLQEWGQDKRLFANTNFSTDESRGTPLLESILSQLRRNDGGVDTVMTTPYTLGLLGCGALTDDDIVRQIERAARIAGLKPKRIQNFIV